MTGQPVWTSPLACALGMLLITLAACQDSDRHRNEELRQEITRVHDLAMAKMEPMYELRTKLRQLPALRASGDVTAIEACLDALTRADEAMFGWMRQYQPLAIASTIAADSDYRVEQLRLIGAVDHQIDEAISLGQRCLSGERVQPD